MSLGAGWRCARRAAVLVIAFLLGWPIAPRAVATEPAITLDASGERAVEPAVTSDARRVDPVEQPAESEAHTGGEGQVSTELDAPGAADRRGAAGSVGGQGAPGSVGRQQASGAVDSRDQDASARSQGDGSGEHADLVGIGPRTPEPGGDEAGTDGVARRTPSGSGGLEADGSHAEPPLSRGVTDSERDASPGHGAPTGAPGQGADQDGEAPRSTIAASASDVPPLHATAVRRSVATKFGSDIAAMASSGAAEAVLRGELRSGGRLDERMGGAHTTDPASTGVAIRPDDGGGPAWIGAREQSATAMAVHLQATSVAWPSAEGQPAEAAATLGAGIASWADASLVPADHDDGDPTVEDGAPPWEPFEASLEDPSGSALAVAIVEPGAALGMPPTTTGAVANGPRRADLVTVAQRLARTAGAGSDASRLAQGSIASVRISGAHAPPMGMVPQATWSRAEAPDVADSARTPQAGASARRGEATERRAPLALAGWPGGGGDSATATASVAPGSGGATSQPPAAGAADAWLLRGSAMWFAVHDRARVARSLLWAARIERPG